MAKGEKLKEWKRANQYRLIVDFSKANEEERPLIERLEAQDNKSGYIKRLISQDIGKGAE